MVYRMMSRILALVVALCLFLALMPASPALAAPQVSMSPTSGARGIEVTVTGTNFTSYIGDVIHILFGGAEIAGSPIVVPPNGTFVATFDVPAYVASGTAYISVMDAYGTELGRSNPFTVVGSDIRIEPEAGTVDTAVTIYGKGLYANRKVTFYYYTNDPRTRINIGVEIASPVGECTYSFTVPDSVGGSHRVLALDASGSEAEASFDVIPFIASSPTSAPVGGELTVSGNGFDSSSNVTIYLGGREATIQRTDEYGSFEVVLSLSGLRPGTYDIEVRDESGNVRKAQVTMTAKISLNKVTGHIGEEVTVSGTGFVSGLPVVINYDSIPVAEGAVDASGAFSVTFNVPVSIHGNHEVAATVDTNVLTSLFSVESVAPPVPKLLLPEDASKMEPDTYFDWEDVSDPSGVTYTLQIATDARFSSVLLEKTELTFSDYTIAEEEGLPPTEKDAFYYWRVKAVDRASNESEWSRPLSFFLSVSTGMPDGVKYALIAIGVVLLGIVIFKWRRRAAQYEDTHYEDTHYEDTHYEDTL